MARGAAAEIAFGVAPLGRMRRKYAPSHAAVEVQMSAQVTIVALRIPVARLICSFAGIHLKMPVIRVLRLARVAVPMIVMVNSCVLHSSLIVHRRRIHSLPHLNLPRSLIVLALLILSGIWALRL